MEPAGGQEFSVAMWAREDAEYPCRVLRVSLGCWVAGSKRNGQNEGFGIKLVALNIARAECELVAYSQRTALQHHISSDHPATPRNESC